MKGANLHSVQRILRHSDPRTTAGTYLHLEPGCLRKEIDLLSFAPSEANRSAREAKPANVNNTGNRPLAAILLLGPQEGDGAGQGGEPKPVEASATYEGAGYRARTGDIQLGKLTLYQLS